MEPNAHVPTDDLVAALRAAGCVYAEDEAAILLEAAATTAELRAMTARRVTGQPLEHIVGWAQFHGMRITVAPDVFVPRLRTEFLVRQALVVLTDAGASGVVLDLCCGSGAVGAALAVEVSGLDIHAADIDPAAVACARRNLGPFGGQAHCGDLFDALPERLKGRLSMITANAPYVPTAEIAFMPPEARLYEPDAALNGGADGLDIQRRIAGLAPAWLCPGGSLLVETSVRQAAGSAAVMAAHGFSTTTFHSDTLDGTVVVGKWGVPAP